MATLMKENIELELACSFIGLAHYHNGKIHDWRDVTLDSSTHVARELRVLNPQLQAAERETLNLT